MTDTTVVVPTLGRPSLAVLLDALVGGTRPPDHPVVVVDDRPEPTGPLPVDGRLDVVVLRSGGRGPAAARNLGWREARTPWVSFLDDDVVPDPDWYACLLVDLDKAPLGCPGPRAGCAFPCPRTGGPPTGSAPREGWRPRPGSRRT